MCGWCGVCLHKPCSAQRKVLHSCCALQGVYSCQPAAAEGLGEEDWEAMADGSWEEGTQRAVLADLPGLIEGAHVVCGLVCV